MSRPTRATAAGRAYLDLQNRARRERRGTQELLTMYAVERWLARLAKSQFVDQFVLKGGMLLAAYGTRRPTVDADTLARGLASDEQAVAARIAEIAAMPDEDGVEYDIGTVTTSTIREGALYSGVRVTMAARLATAQVKLRLDVNFGDPVTPTPQLIELPSLRPDAEPVRVFGYPLETVFAEKIVTGLELGAASTRVRDWVDLYVLTGTHRIQCGSARAALHATAGFRETTLIPLSDAVGMLVPLRSPAYNAYRRGLGPDGASLPAEFADVVEATVEFADPLIAGADPEAWWSPERRQWVSPDSRVQYAGG